MIIPEIAMLCVSIITHEGVVQRIYEDSLGFRTVGIGHKVLPHEPEAHMELGSFVSLDRISTLFAEDCEAAVSNARSVVRDFDTHPLEVRNILVEMAFQLGKTGLSKFEKMLHALDYRDYITASAEMVDSKWHSQTTSRAEALAERMCSYAIPF